MSGAYRVASLLPESARRAAVEAEYGCTLGDGTAPLKQRQPDEVTFRRTSGGCCPLGVALQALGVEHALAPHSLQFADLAVELALCDFEELASARTAALDFIQDWDNAKITDLAAALDVEPSQAPPGSALADEQGPAPQSAGTHEDFGPK